MGNPVKDGLPVTATLVRWARLRRRSHWIVANGPSPRVPLTASGGRTGHAS
jgi:hypothetical protein